MTSSAGGSATHFFFPQTNLEAVARDGPLVISRGEDVRLWDDGGTCYLDGMAALWCVGLGYSEPRLVEAATRQLNRLPFAHSFQGRSHEPGLRLADELVRIAPNGLSRVFFASSGSEANDTAIKMVWYYWNALGAGERKVILARKRAYHGVTLATASLTGLPMMHGGFDAPLPFVEHLTAPHYAQQAQEGESEEAFSARLAGELEATIARIGADRIAAFIAEPVIGAGGVITPPKGYFEAIQPILQRHGILFIVDEVITGFGRTGAMWGSETYALKPDILTCAKMLTSGYVPLSAVLVSQAIHAVIAAESGRRGSFGHGFTYSAHPVPAAVALEVLAIYRERDIIGQVAAKAPQFAHRLAAIGQNPLVRDVRASGLLGGIEMRDPKDAARLQAAAQSNGLFVRAVGGDTVAICPPLIISEGEIDLLFDRLGGALRSL